ncbi:MAG: catalase [Moritella sp.]|jgi:catalase
MTIQNAQETRLIDEMESILQEKMELDYIEGSTMRDAHPKCLGLAKANFTVATDIPTHLQVGVFKTPKTYKSWIRFSNASGQVKSDKEKDFRGLAIKLLGVTGERFNDNEQQTQDFLLMSHSTMPLGTVKLFRDAVYYSIKWNPLILVMKLLLTGKVSVLKTMKIGKKNDASLLDLNYWSTTPYAFGNNKVKYKIVPTSASKSQLPAKLTDDYLTKNMNEQLQHGSATFDFYIQEFKDEHTTPIEDAAVEWSEQHSPFIKVAQIEIQEQAIDSKERFDLAEVFSFSPANALLDHKPIGGLNRARIRIYNNLSRFRHARNAKSQIEPALINYDLTE